MNTNLRVTIDFGLPIDRVLKLLLDLLVVSFDLLNIELDLTVLAEAVQYPLVLTKTLLALVKIFLIQLNKSGAGEQAV